MATQITSELIADAEWYLSAAERELAEADYILASWHTLNDVEKMDFWAEWPLVLDHLQRVEGYRVRATLTSEQAARLSDAQDRLSRLEPSIDRAFTQAPAVTAAKQSGS